jgi:hypothetical protein
MRDFKKRGYNVLFFHSDKLDYNNLIYLPVLRSNYLSRHRLTFTNNEKNMNVYYKELINKCDLIVLEISVYDLAFSLEVKDSIISGKPLLVLIQEGVTVDEHFAKLLDNIITYKDENEFRNYVETFVRNYEGKINDGKLDPTLVLGVLN